MKKAGSTDPVYVEWHNYCGPTIMTKEWHESAFEQPGPRSNFWELTIEWKRAKFAIDEQGYCLDREGKRLGAIKDDDI